MKINVKLTLVFVLILGTVAAGFSIDNNKQNYQLNGTWRNGPFTLIVEDNVYTSKLFNINYGRGMVMYNENDTTLISSYAWDPVINDWRQFNEVIKGQYLLQKDKLTVFNVDGIYKDFNGIWERLDIDRGQNITSI